LDKDLKHETNFVDASRQKPPRRFAEKKFLQNEKVIFPFSMPKAEIGKISDVYLS
jgi:hypothetical protein